MPKAATRKLKVFQAQFGFYDTVLAAPSQAAALQVWGVRQNLFADGQARVTDDLQAVEAARAHPGVILKRAVGSKDPFALESRNLPKLPAAPKESARASGGKASPKPVARPPADRGPLEAAEAILAALSDARKRQEAELARRQEALDAERADAQAAYVAEHKAAAAEVVAARRAYRSAGGRD